VIRCKGCGENIPAMVETLPASWIAVKCPTMQRAPALSADSSVSGQSVLCVDQEACAERTGRDKVSHVRSQRTHAPSQSRPDLHGRVHDCGHRLAREKQVNVRVTPASHAIDESVELAHEIFNRVFRKVPEKIERRDEHGEG
jgi:hypothetical protein